MDLEEPPLQAEIMMSSSMTLSLILNRQSRHCGMRCATYWLLPLWTRKQS